MPPRESIPKKGVTIMAKKSAKKGKLGGKKLEKKKTLIKLGWE
jgi:hypothetical protein